MGARQWCTMYSLGNAVCIGMFVVVFFREEMGMFVQKPSYMTSVKILSSVKSKIDGWEVRISMSLYNNGLKGCNMHCSTCMYMYMYIYICMSH